MGYEKPSKFVGPHGYKTAGKILVDNDLIPLSFDKVVIGVTRFLNKRPQIGAYSRKSREVREALAKDGLWGYTCVYWDEDSFCFQDDMFGMGSDRHRVLGEDEGTVLRPLNPKRTFRFDPKIFGRFSPNKFTDSPSRQIMGDFSEDLAELAYRNGIDICIKGNFVKKSKTLMTVCALEIKNGALVLNLKEDENSRHYAIGKTASNYDPLRFTQP